MHVKLFFYHPALALSFHTTQKNYSTLIHSFGMGLFFQSIYIYIHFCQESLLSSFISLSFQTLKQCRLTIHFLSEGIDFSVFFNSFFYHFHCSINPCFWEGVDVACKLFFYHPTLLCYSMLLGKNYSTLIHSFDRGLIIYILSHSRL